MKAHFKWSLLLCSSWRYNTQAVFPFCSLSRKICFLLCLLLYSENIIVLVTRHVHLLNHHTQGRPDSQIVGAHTTWAQRPQTSPWFDSQLAGLFAACHSTIFFLYVFCLSPLLPSKSHTVTRFQNTRHSLVKTEL